MSTATPILTCPVCEKSIPSFEAGCANCRLSGPALEQVQALDFLSRRFEQWHSEGQIYSGKYPAIAEDYRQRRRAVLEAVQSGQPLPPNVELPPADRCWSCREECEPGKEMCATCGAPLGTSAVRSLRFLLMLCGEIKNQEQAARLSLSQSHGLLNETRERIAALRQRLEQHRVLPVRPAAPRKPRRKVVPVLELAEPETPHRPLMEIILDPANIQWLLIFGGALLALGLVIFVGTLGLLEDPRAIAVVMGIANLAVLLGGWAMIKYSRYQVAGRALTLLACLLMPFNLWFYDANNLITLDGRLWLAALVCCGLYAASALLLRDEMFVYVLAAGVAMTALLLLASRDISRFWEIATPATVLVVLGVVSILAERAFPDGEGPFTRRRFGLAFFWSGHALLASGLLLVMGAQLVGWFWQPLFRHFRFDGPSAIVTDQALKIQVLCLFLAGCAAYIWSDVVVRRIGVYIYLAAVALLWSELQAILLVDKVPSEVIILILTLTALAVNLAQTALFERQDLTRAIPPLGMFLSVLPVVFGLALHFRAVNPALKEVWLRADGGPFVVTWGFVGAMLATAVSCRISAYLYRYSQRELSVVYFFLTAAATLVAAAGIAVLIGLQTWDAQAPVLMLIPIAYLAASRLYRGHTPEKPLVWVAYAATGVMILAVVEQALIFDPQQVFRPKRGDTVNLLLALFWTEAAVFFGLAAAWRKEGAHVYLSAAAACGAVWQLLFFFQVNGEFHTLAFAVLGLLLLLGYRFAVLDRLQMSGLDDAAFRCANALLSVAFVAAVLVTLSRLALPQSSLAQLSSSGDWRAPLQTLIGVQAALTVISLLAAWLVRDYGWRRWYLVAALSNLLLAFLVIHRLSQLSPWQQLEIFCIVLGSILLALGHWGWYREQERQSDLTTLGLHVGSMLVAIPLIIAVLIYRSTATWSGWNELGLLGLGVLMVSSGVMLRLQATTIFGGLMTAVAIVTLPMYLRTPRWVENLEVASILMIVGGGVVFLTGLLLSIYRDRLLALPEKIKRREGIFKLLSWR